ncbi:hypothetical protein Agub_g5118, partial [Astrephomene gubernaculifera]
CLDELHRSAPAAAAGAAGAADTAASRPDWTHLFLSVLPPLPLPPGGRDDARVAAALRSAAAALVARHGGALRQAAVAVWETRLRGPLREAAWRVVVSMPTGHEHGEEHVEVYREALQESYLQHQQAKQHKDVSAAAAPGKLPHHQQIVSPAQLPVRVYVPALLYPALHSLFPPASYSAHYAATHGGGLVHHPLQQHHHRHHHHHHAHSGGG